MKRTLLKKHRLEDDSLVKKGEIYMELKIKLERKLLELELKNEKIENLLAELIILENLIADMLSDLVRKRSIFLKRILTERKEEIIKIDPLKIDSKLQKMTLGNLVREFLEGFHENYIKKFGVQKRSLEEFVKKRNYVHHKLLQWPPKYKKADIKPLLQQTIEIGKKCFFALSELNFELTKEEWKRLGIDVKKLVEKIAEKVDQLKKHPEYVKKSIV